MGSKITFTEEATQVNVIRMLIRMGYASFSPNGKTLHVTGGATNGNLRLEETEKISKLPGVASVS